jgi:hypothetical protein
MVSPDAIVAFDYSVSSDDRFRSFAWTDVLDPQNEVLTRSEEGPAPSSLLYRSRSTNRRWMTLRSWVLALPILGKSVGLSRQARIWAKCFVPRLAVQRRRFGPSFALCEIILYTVSALLK